MKTVRLSFPNRDDVQLSAHLDLPLGERPQAYAILAHCFTCGKNLKGERNISRALTQNGLAVLRFDFAGLGESDGEFYDTNFSTNVADLLDAAAFLDQEYEAPQLLVGHSLGGTAVLMAGGQLDSVRAVATIGAPAEPHHVKRLFEAFEARIQAEGEARIELAGRPFTIRRQFLEDLEQVQLKDLIQQLGKALLVMHSPQDETVEVENARQIYDAARHPKSFLTLDGADHLLLRKPDSLYAGQMVAHWASRYLNLEEDEPLVTDKQAVVRVGGKGYTSEIRVGKHRFLADEPASVGGDDLGPSPYDLLVSGLGACTAMTLRMYADRKGWPLSEVRVHLEHYKDYPTDRENTEAKQSKIDHIERYVELEGPLDAQQQQRLLEIADRCPVHRTLHNDVEVRSVLRSEQ